MQFTQSNLTENDISFSNDLFKTMNGATYLHLHRVKVMLTIKNPQIIDIIDIVSCVLDPKLIFHLTRCFNNTMQLFQNQFLL